MYWENDITLPLCENKIIFSTTDYSNIYHFDDLNHQLFENGKLIFKDSENLIINQRPLFIRGGKFYFLGINLSKLNIKVFDFTSKQSSIINLEGFDTNDEIKDLELHKIPYFYDIEKGLLSFKIRNDLKSSFYTFQIPSFTFVESLKTNLVHNFSNFFIYQDIIYNFDPIDNIFYKITKESCELVQIKGNFEKFRNITFHKGKVYSIRNKEIFIIDLETGTSYLIDLSPRLKLNYLQRVIIRNNDVLLEILKLKHEYYRLFTSISNYQWHLPAKYHNIFIHFK